MNTLFKVDDHVTIVVPPDLNHTYDSDHIGKVARIIEATDRGTMSSLYKVIFGDGTIHTFHEGWLEGGWSLTAWNDFVTQSEEGR